MKKLLFILLCLVSLCSYSQRRLIVNGNRQKPYIQKVQYSSVAQATTHTITFSSTPVSGHLLIIFAWVDKGAVTTPAGWTLDATKTSGSLNLVAYHKISAGTETSTAITCVASIMAAVAFEYVLPGANTGAVDDLGLVAISQSTATNDIKNAITSNAVDLIFAVAGFYNTAHVNTGDGPYSFDKGFAQQGYSLANSSGTSGVSIELVTSFLKTTATGTYDSNVTATTLETSTTGSGFIIAYK